MIKPGKTIWYCPIINELWVFEPSLSWGNSEVYYAVTWNDICFVTETLAEQSFIYVGDL